MNFDGEFINYVFINQALGFGSIKKLKFMVIKFQFILKIQLILI